MPTISSGTSTGLIISGQSYYVWSAGTVSSTTVNYSGLLDLYNGGRAFATVVNSSGTVYVSSGGYASGTTVNNRGAVYIYFSGSAINLTANSNGYITVAAAARHTMSRFQNTALWRSPPAAARTPC